MAQGADVHQIDDITMYHHEPLRIQDEDGSPAITRYIRTLLDAGWNVDDLSEFEHEQVRYVTEAYLIPEQDTGAPDFALEAGTVRGSSSLLESVNSKTISEDEQLREFVFDFISVDPIYFRSGYEKERLLKLLKSLEFTAHEKSVLCHTILHRVKHGTLREFRRFCQLIPKIQNDDFVFELKMDARSSDLNVRRRAVFALRYVAS